MQASTQPLDPVADDLKTQQLISVTCSHLADPAIDKPCRAVLCRGLLALLAMAEYAAHGYDESRTAVVIPEACWPEQAGRVGSLVEALDRLSQEKAA